MRDSPTIKYLTPWAREMFPPALHSRPKVGTHFNEISLHQMTPFRKAAAIADMCDAHMLRLTAAPYTLVDAFAGIGGNAMVFALNARVHTVVALESDALTHSMLRRNMANLQNPAAAWVTRHDKCTLDALRAEVRAAPTPACIFMDPPWGMYKPYIDIMEPPEPGSPPVLHWLAALADEPRLLCVVVKAPKRYKWDNAKTPTGWCFEQNSTLAKMEILVFSKAAPLQAPD